MSNNVCTVHELCVAYLHKAQKATNLDDYLRLDNTQRRMCAAIWDGLHPAVLYQDARSYTALRAPRGNPDHKLYVVA